MACSTPLSLAPTPAMMSRDRDGPLAWRYATTRALTVAAAASLVLLFDAVALGILVIVAVAVDQWIRKVKA